MATKKVTVDRLLRADDLRDFVQALGFEPSEVEAMVVCVRLANGDFRYNYKCDSFLALGMVDVTRQGILDEIEKGEVRQ